MGWILIGVLVLMLATGAGRAFVNADPATVARWLRIGGGLAAGILGMVLLVRGVFALAIPLMGVALALLGAAGGMSRTGGGGGRTSVVQTESVRMTLDHASGRMDGEVRRGPRKGERLSKLSLSDIDALIVEAEADDPDGVALLRTYRQRRFRKRDEAGDAGASRAPSGEMTVGEAYAVLGLEPGAKEESIRDAHRRLMLQAHPDRGGSAWLAAKINRAKDILLEKS